ncbi:hypothetical protein JYT91_00960 [archaeon AH-315-M20]|nr:hypothetical protein [archaeon AH-315-M20]
MRYYLFVLMVLGIFLISACSSTTTTAQKVEPTITVLDYPTEVSDDKPFVVKWNVDGGSTGEITHTAVHYDYESHGPDFKEYKEVSAIYTGETPKEFSANINALKVGFVFFRAHAIVDGENVYSDEMKVEVIPYKGAEEAELKTCPECLEPTDWDTCANGKQTRQIYVCGGETNFLCQDRSEERDCVVEPEPEPQAEVKEFSIEVSDNSFKPDRVSAKEGDIVKITFKAVPPNSFGGADVRDRDGLVKTGKISPGEEKTVEFTMPSRFVTLTNYWPASTRKKTQMDVLVDKT